MKRSRYKIETPVTSALKNMRNARGLSLVKTARLLNMKEAKVNHYENGRIESVPDDYVEKFVTKLGFTMQDWEDFLNGRTSVYDLRQECREFISKLDRDKLKAIHTMLLSFVGSR
jgi:transcriptional regulator with XRE-family HTH domain